MQGFGSRKRAIHFHGAEVKALPDNAVVLASTPHCAVSAFAVGPAAFGIQYHAEANDAIVTEWTELPSGKAFVERIYGAEGPARVRAEVVTAMPELLANAHRLYANFMGIVRARA
jgi:GMP synthase-like glutamine amidotransferase